MVELGGARIRLPAGWVARDLTRYSGPGENPIFPGWCLTPSFQPVSVDDDGCALTLTQVDAPAGELDVDSAGGFASDPEDCGQSPETGHEQYGDRTLGGRAADWRRQTDTCTDTAKAVLKEQYVVPTAPGWILYSDDATDATDADPQTYSYVIPKAVFTGSYGRQITVGDLVTLESNGTRVTSIS